MRGDSRRDLYSKVLALCGLGVLAGAGVVVDYWPVAVRFPSAQAPRADVGSTPAAPLMRDDAFVVLASLMDVERGVRRRSPSSTAPIRTITDAASGPGASLPVSTAGVFDIGTPIDLDTRPVTVIASVRQQMPEPSIEPVRLVAPAPGHRLETGFAGAADGGDEPGFITSAFRKTGSSIVRTGVRTGTSLVDAVRVVGGAVRRAWPD